MRQQDRPHPPTGHFHHAPKSTRVSSVVIAPEADPDLLRAVHDTPETRMSLAYTRGDDVHVLPFRPLCP